MHLYKDNPSWSVTDEINTIYIYIFFFLSEDGLQLQISNITISVTTVVFKNDILLENILK